MYGGEIDIGYRPGDPQFAAGVDNGGRGRRIQVTSHRQC